MKPKFRSLIAAFAPLSRSSLIVCASLCAASTAYADQTWTGDALDGFWTSTGNWNGAAIPGAADIAIFDITSDTNTATTLAATFSIKGLKIVDPIAAVSIAAGNTLTLGSSGIDMSTATQNLSLASPIVAGVSQPWNVAAGRTLTVTSEVSGPSFTKSGDGTVLLTGTNIMAGAVQLNGGQITVRNGAALGPAGTNTLNQANGTTFRIEATNGGSGTSVFVSNPITVATASSATMTSAVVGNGYSGLITGGANSVYNIGAVGNLVQVSYSLGASTQQFGSFLGRIEITDGGSIRFSSTSGVNNGGAAAIWDTNTTGVITSRNAATVNLGSVVGAGSLSGSSGADGTCVWSIGGRSEDCTFDGSIVSPTAARISALTKVGSATLTLTSATGLTYTGATNVNEGTLKINGVKSGVGSTTVKTTTTLAGTGSIAGTTTIQSGGTLAPGDGGVGNLTFSNLTLNTGSKLNIQFGVGNDKATVSSGGTLTLQSGVNVDVNGFDTDGVYTILDATGVTVNGSVSTSFAATNHNTSKVYSFGIVAGLIQMTISSSDPSNYWNASGAGSWATATNWTKNPEIPNVAGAIAKFGPGQGGLGGSFAGSFEVTLDANKTVGLLSFNDDFGSVITIDPGLVTPGTLLMDNGVAAAEIVNISGDHIINAPVSVDAQGLTVNTGSAEDLTPYSLAINGVVSGASAALVKNGAGNLVLTGDNNYGGGTVLGAGRVNINSATSLGLTSAPVTFSGGALQLGATLSGITRSYLITGANSANIDTNGFDFAYGGVVSPVGGATGGLTKSGAGIMTLTTAQTYTGTTAANGGELVLDTGAVISGGSITTGLAGGGLIHTKNTGTLTATFGALSPQTGGLFMGEASGNVTFSGALTAINTTSNGNSSPIRVSSGTLSATNIQLGRTGLSTTTEPTAAPINTNLYLSGGAVTLSGDLNVGAYTGSTAPNSSVVTRIDAGTLTVGGAISIGINNAGRWSYFDMNGGTLVNNGAVADSGLVIGGPLIGKAAFLMRAGTATVERIQFGRGVVDGEGLLNIGGGALYVGSGGISLGSTGIFTSQIRLSGGTLGAKAAWSSAMPVGITVNSTIKAADVANVAHDISIAGIVDGVGGIEKTGGGTLTLSGPNTYAGTTLVSAGNLAITGDSSGALGAVNVDNGATLSGNGSIGGSVTIQSGAHHALAVAATPGAQVTRVITGTLDLVSGNILDLTSAGPIADGVYVLATATGGIVGDLGSFTLSGGLTGTPSKSGNNLILTVSSSAYASWASGFGLQDPWLGVDPALNGTPGADPDNDGIKNELEFVLGGNPTLSSTNILPTLVVTATNFVYTFNRVDASEAEVALTFQSSTTLAAGSWTPLAIGVDTAASGAGVEVAENGAAADTITVTIAKGANTKIFGRLQAVK